MWKKKKPTALLFFIFVILFIFLSNAFFISHPLKSFFLDASKIPLKIINLSFVPFKVIAHCHNYLRENRDLKKEKEELKISAMLLKDADDENKRLRKLLSFKEKSKLNLVSSKIIAGDGSNFKKSVVLDKGKNHGIHLADTVITADGLVGKVIELGRYTSRVMLINDPDFALAAKVKRSGVIGLLAGSLEGNCILKYLELDDDVKENDEIVTSSRDGNFPSGIPIGEVISVLKEHSGLTLFAVIKPKIRFNTVEEVLVIINEKGH